MQYDIARRAKQFPAVLAWWLGLLLCCGIPTLGEAAVEGIPCTPEPTDMVISYGDVVTCAIDVIGDTDVFRFSGSAGEKVVVQVSVQSGPGTPLIELFRPDGTPIPCWICMRINAMLDQTGTYTILVTERGNNGTVGYLLALERVAPPSPSARRIQYSESITDEINPVGDADLFFFQASAGDHISVQVSVQSGPGTPLIELFRPDGTPIPCWICMRIDAMLDQTGTYTILVTERGNNGTVGYLLALQCVGGRCSTPTTGALQVTVRRSDTGAFLSGASVSLSGPSTPSSQTTDGSGTTTYSNLSTGTYTVTTSLTGFQTNSTTATVSANTTTAVAISLTPTPTPTTTGVLQVTVRRSDTNVALAGALVTVSTPGTLQSQTTGSNGTTTFSNLQAGSYSVTVSLTGYQTGSNTATVSANTTSSVTILLTSVTTTGTFSGWSPVPGGGQTGSQPAAVVDSTGTLRLYIQGIDNGLWVKQKSGGIWSDWSRVAGGGSLDGPAAFLDGTAVRLVVRGLDNSLWTALDDASPIAWQHLGGRTERSPVALMHTGSPSIYIRGLDGRLYEALRDQTGVWSQWAEVLGGGQSSGQPAAVVDITGTLHIYLQGIDNALWTNQVNPTLAWGQWTVGVGGRSSVGPAAILDGDRVRLVVRGLDNRVWTILSSDSQATQWGAWEDLGGQTLSTPAAVVRESTLHIFVRGTDGRLYMNSRTGGSGGSESLMHLAEQMDRFHRTFDVYTDVGAAGNHFVMLGKIGNDPGAVDIDPCSVGSLHSGVTGIKNIFRNTTGRNWGGWYFLNGVLTGNEQQPSANWGDIPNAGIDLRGATQLTFWARGVGGGEKIEFFMGGVGRNAETGAPIAPFPDSTRRIPRPGTTITLTTNWTQYTIDLSGVDLSYILGGFGWVASAESNPQGAVFWIDAIQYNKARLDEPRFILSYVTISSSQPFDTVLRNAAFTYDNAIAMLAFMARGTEDDWRRAKLIAEALVYAQAHDRFYGDGRLRNAYQAGDLALPPGWAPNGKVGTVRMPGFWDCTQEQWFEDRFQVSTHTGNVAWPMIALLTYYQKRGGAQYLEAARVMGEWIEGRRQGVGFGGYRGGFEGWEKPSTEFPSDPVDVPWGSAEHNLDIFVAFTKMFQVTGDPIWRDRAAHARAFAEAMWDPARGCFLTGTKDANTLNRDVLPLDVQAWSVLALPDVLNKSPSVLQCAETNHRTDMDRFRGFDFNEDRDGVWFEGTGHMAVAYTVARQTAKAAEFVAQLRLAQTFAPNANGEGLVAASHDGVTTGFLQLNGKDPLLLFARLHIAATGWHIFAELGVNPYYLFPAELTLSLNQTVFRRGEILIVGIGAHNLGLAFNGDFYFGSVLPDGRMLVFLTSLSLLDFVVTTLDADPQTFQPLVRNALIPENLDITIDHFASFTFSGGEPSGAYIVFAALTKPGAFNDRSNDPGDILTVGFQSFSFSP